MCREPNVPRKINTSEIVTVLNGDHSEKLHIYNGITLGNIKLVEIDNEETTFVESLNVEDIDVAMNDTLSLLILFYVLSKRGDQGKNKLIQYIDSMPLTIVVDAIDVHENPIITLVEAISFGGANILERFFEKLMYDSKVKTIRDHRRQQKHELALEMESVLKKYETSVGRPVRVQDGQGGFSVERLRPGDAALTHSGNEIDDECVNAFCVFTKK